MKHGETSLPGFAPSSRISDLRLPTSTFTRPFLALCVGALLWRANATATTAGFNPYSGIVERNSFGLKPPINPADLVKPPPPLVADIKLQGITTILGRKQVLMKVRIPAKPPEPARDQSVVLSEGQREGEVEVLEINPADGTVKINNAGTILPLNMKDNGEKPTPGAAMPTSPAIHGAPGLPGVPPPAASAVPTAALPAAVPGSPAVESFGGNKTIPTRAMRTTSDGALGGVNSSAAAGAVRLTPDQQVAAQRTPDETMALQLLNQAKNEQLIQSGVKMPRIRFPVGNALNEGAKP